MRVSKTTYTPSPFILDTELILVTLLVFLLGCDIPGKEKSHGNIEHPNTNIKELMSWGIEDFGEHIGIADKCYGKIEEVKTCHYGKMDPYFLVYSECNIALLWEEYLYSVTFLEGDPVSIVIRGLELPLNKHTWKVFGLDVKEKSSWSYSSYSRSISVSWNGQYDYDLLGFHSCKNKSVFERARFVRDREYSISLIPAIDEHISCNDLHERVERDSGVISYDPVERYRGCRDIVVD